MGLLGHRQDGGHGRGSAGSRQWWDPSEMRENCQAPTMPKKRSDHTDARVQFECYQADQSRQMRNTHMVQKDQWISGDELLFLLVQGHSQFSTFPRDEKGERKRGLWKTKQVHK